MLYSLTWECVTPTLSVRLACLTGSWSRSVRLGDGCSLGALFSSSSLTSELSPEMRKQIMHTEVSVLQHVIRQWQLYCLYCWCVQRSCLCVFKLKAVFPYQLAALPGCGRWSGRYAWRHRTPVHHLEGPESCLLSSRQSEAGIPPTSTTTPNPPDIFLSKA